MASLETALKALKKPAIVSICGPSCAGKTTLALHLAKCGLGQVLPMDAFYAPVPKIPLHLPGIPAFDSPQAFDMPRLIRCLLKIRHGYSVPIPIYHYSRTHNGRDQGRERIFAPQEVTILDGILSFTPKLRGLIDFAVYLDRAPNARREARLQRDIKERGVNLERATELYDKMAVPLFAKHGASQQHHAHSILVNR